MMGFKDMVAADRRSVFLNGLEFADDHLVEGKTIRCVIDDDRLRERQAGSELAVAESYMLLYAACEDLPPRRRAGAALNVDHRELIVDDWSEDMGIATIALRVTV